MTHYPHFPTIRFEKGFLLIIMCHGESQMRVQRYIPLGVIHLVGTQNFP